MSPTQVKIADLMARRAEIDAELQGLHAQAVAELEAVRAQVAEIEAALHIKRALPEKLQIVETQPADECDGPGPEEVDDNSYQGFVGELKSLRDYNMSRRRRHA